MWVIIKKILFPFKKFLLAVFSYPKAQINREMVADYDTYWREKRGESIGNISDWQKARAGFVVATLKNESNISLGDFGCGDGSILSYLSTKLNVKKMVGYDLSDFALEKAKSRGIETYNVESSLDSEALREIIQPTDYMLMFEVLEHIPNSEVLLNIACQKAEKGVFFSIPNSGYFTHRLRVFFGKSYAQWRVHPSEHLRFWTLRDLEWWLKAQGYSRRTIFPYKGIRILNFLLPNLFSAGVLVFIPKK